jgi:uncharacterized protein (DUF2236 family)/RimJ/RimL family protein N-acetyltransferase
MITWRRLTEDDFPLLKQWLERPHVARWWNHETSIEAVTRDFGPAARGEEPSEDLLVLRDDQPFGLVQRCWLADYPEYLAELRAIVEVPEGTMTIDYLIGDLALTGRGLGTEMIRATVEQTWAEHPTARCILVPVPVANRASWQALAKAGLRRVGEGELEPDNPIDDRAHVFYRIDRARPIEPGTRMWDQVGLVTFSLTTGTAFLLQTMEPTISAVLDEHSTFRTDPIGRARRSLASVQLWVYGGEEALAEADRLRQLHTTLNTTEANGVRHTALSAGPWAWVLHTGTFAFVEGARYFARRPLTAAEKEDYYQETLQLLRNFSVVPKEIPSTYAEFIRYFNDIVEHRLVDTSVARDYLKLIQAVPRPKWLPGVLKPLWRFVMGPVGRIQYFVTVGTAPQAARRKLGLEWTARDERKLRALGRLIARAVPLLPERVRYFPIAYRARRLEHDRQRLRAVIERRPV